MFFLFLTRSSHPLLHRSEGMDFVSVSLLYPSIRPGWVQSKYFLSEIAEETRAPRQWGEVVGPVEDWPWNRHERQCWSGRVWGVGQLMGEDRQGGAPCLMKDRAQLSAGGSGGVPEKCGGVAD